jgi:pilus assembly protein CpaD
MPINKTPIAAVIVLALGFTSAGCSSSTDAAKAGLESVHQPVVSRNNYTLDVEAGSGGLSYVGRERLSDWFNSMDLRYGDRVSIDDPTASNATRREISEIAGRFGLLVAEGAPVTPGAIVPGSTRVIITRSTASVPGCPDWSSSTSSNFKNETQSGFGCAVNSNLAAMVANPEDLIRGASDTGRTTIMSSNKAIDAYRNQKATDPKVVTKNQTSDVGN